MSEENIITVQELEKLLNMYNVSKKSLANLLDWSRPTISRYLTGESIPSLNYSNTLKRLLDPNEMKSLVDTNSHKISPSSYKKITTCIENIKLSNLTTEFPGEVFIKRINSHELGYRKEQPNKAGSFLLVPKTTIHFFPNLDKAVPNSNINLKVNFNTVEEPFIMNYVWHNSKFATTNPNENRDEHRLYSTYLNNFKPDDVVIFIKTEEENCYTAYKISQYSNSYTKLLLIIDKYKEGRASAVVVPTATLISERIPIEEIYDVGTTSNVDELLEEPLQLSEDETDAISSNYIDQLDFSDLFDSKLLSSNLETLTSSVKKLKRNKRFKNAVLTAYDNKCCITNDSVYFKGKTNLQACHIIPKHKGGSDNPKNGIALSQDLHWCFDEGYITINDDYSVVVHQKVLENKMLKPLNGEYIHLPEDLKFRPSLEAIKFHRDNIFGSFSKD